MMRHTITVNLHERSYPIYVGNDMLSGFAPTLQRHGIPRQLVVITDSHIAPHYLQPLLKHLRHFDFDASAIVVPPGEQQKSLRRATSIFTTLLERGIGRKSAVLALGGGVVGDLSGFIAATYHRGITLVQMPTTLLSQVDSAVGGKTAVNHPLGKNMIGAFYQPSLVWADMHCLRTLPPREVTCGLGEIVKYGVIADAEFFAYLESHLDRALVLDEKIILHIQSVCCGIKARLVSEDERETGRRVILNYGHTVGHALEAAGAFRVVKHGEGVLVGMVAETYIARELGMISGDVHDRIVKLIQRIPIRARFHALKPADILRAMSRDKKTVSGKKRFVLPTNIGNVTVVEMVEEKLIRTSLKHTWQTLQ
ncbi:MAG: 3-dehydroquinate synthase [Ignavibacteriales bacterium]|nr:3-dehydroquinate synthase [Ignavibacteriales bacterium]